jgi:predicted chitinase
MSQGINLLEDSSNDIEEWLIAPSVPPLPLSRKRPRDTYVGGEDTQAADHRESDESIVAAASQPMNSDSEQISRNERSAKKRSKKRSTSKPSSSASGREGKVSSWKIRFSELADYRKIYGHCNVPTDYSENLKLSKWVANQRTKYRLHLEGTKSSFKLSRIQELESMGFEWEVRVVPPIRLSGKRPQNKNVGSEDAQEVDHRESHEGIDAAASQPMNSDSEEISRNHGSTKKRSKKRSASKPPSNAAGRQMKVTTWNDRFEELADYREGYGDCNVPKSFSKNFKLASWVETQRTNYRLYQEEKSTRMTSFRIEELKRIDFEFTDWEECLSELAEYRIVHGHCNIPKNCSENSKLASWVAIQRKNYKLRREGKTIHMSLPRIQELESLGFEWKPSLAPLWEDRLSELAEYRKVHGHCNVPKNCSENSRLASWVAIQRKTYRLQREGKKSHMTPLQIQALENLGFEWNSLGAALGAAWEDRLSELADYRKNQGHCNVPHMYSENTKLAHWVTTQRKTYRLHQEGKTSPMTLSRIRKLESIDFEWASHGAAWEDRLSELADYRKIYGHCNVPNKYSENTRLGNWVQQQRRDYRSQLEGKKSPLTTFRIQALESLGFEWDCLGTAWEDRLSELADFRKIHGHCNVPTRYTENRKLGEWVGTQRNVYKLRREGKSTPMTTARIEKMESLGFEWDCLGTAWEKRLSELADYRKIHGHCNVPSKYTENRKLGEWVGAQRNVYKLRREGKSTLMTTARIQKMESLDFEWVVYRTAWEDRLSELVDYRTIHGHCNVPQSYSGKSNLGTWVAKQRSQYRLQLEGKKSHMPLPRIQVLESLNFEWKSPIRRGGGAPKQPSIGDDTMRVRETAVDAPEHLQTTAQTQEDFSARDIRSNQADVAFESEESHWNGEVNLAYRAGRTEEI